VAVLSSWSNRHASSGLVAAFLAMVISQPALANSAANADIAAPLRAAQASKPTIAQDDEEFRRLFNSWKALDNRQLVGAARPAAFLFAQVPAAATPLNFALPVRVSIPSRMPVEGAVLTSGYGLRWHPVLGGRRQHQGVDLAEPSGTAVYATADGVISRADWFSSYGLFISIEHGGNIQTRYGHLSRLNVASGQAVRKGDLIGFVGSTGRSTGPHLHYEVRIAGNAVNPIPYLNGVSSSRSTLSLAVAAQEASPQHSATEAPLGGGDEEE